MHVIQRGEKTAWATERCGSVAPIVIEEKKSRVWSSAMMIMISPRSASTRGDAAEESEA